MHSATVHRPMSAEARAAARAAGVLAFLIMLFAAVFGAGYHEVNLVAGAVHTVVATWHIVTSPWTYVAAAFVYGAVKALRVAHA